MTLIEAVRSGNLDRVNAEIATGADINLPAGDTTPLEMRIKLSQIWGSSLSNLDSFNFFGYVMHPRN